MIRDIQNRIKINLKKDKVVELITTTTCNEHSKLVNRLNRIEGENITIISLLIVIVTAVLSRVV